MMTYPAKGPANEKSEKVLTTPAGANRHAYSVPPMPQAPSRTRLTKEARREQLLDTAADMVLTRGFDALTMEAVAQEAGASKTLGYAYFANVENLIESLYERELSALYEAVEAATQEVIGLDARIAAAVHASFDIVEQRGMLIGL